MVFYAVYHLKCLIGARSSVKYLSVNEMEDCAVHLANLRRFLPTHYWRTVTCSVSRSILFRTVCDEQNLEINTPKCNISLSEPYRTDTSNLIA
jgi:hypothetical protein